MAVHARRTIALLSSLLFLATGAAKYAAERSPKGYVLVWGDEFNSKSGSLPDPQKWTYDIGGSGWGNHELEYYTNRVDNAHLEHGHLVITARREDFTAPDGGKFLYTSARLKTQGLFAQSYGRFEARIKIPAGQGIWPAFWMLGDNIEKDGWPRCGEIDIMENIGREPAINHGSLHAPSSTHATSDLTATISLPAHKRLSEKFHLYAVEWESETARFYLDNRLYATFRKTDLPAGGIWVFDRPFFMLLNVAVGGDWPGSPDSTSRFPEKMLVDYVRVYKRQP